MIFLSTGNSIAGSVNDNIPLYSGNYISETNSFTNGLVVHYNGNLSGNSLIDLSGNDNNGFAMNATQRTNNSTSENYINLDANSKIDVSQNAQTDDSNPITIEFIGSVNEFLQYEPIVSKYKSEISGWYLSCSAVSPYNHVRFGAVLRNGGEKFYESNIGLVAGQVYDIVATYDNNVSHIYINGVDSGSSTWNSPMAVNTDNITIGGYVAGLADDSINYNTSLYVFRLYNRSLSSSEVNRNYANYTWRYSTPQTTPGYVIYGFYPDSSNMESYQPNWNKLSYVCFGNWTLNSDGTIQNSNMSYYNTVKDQAHAHGVKITLYIKGTNTGNSVPMNNVLAYHQTDFIDNVTNLLNSTGADGINIDWEWTSPAPTTNPVDGQPAKPEFENLMTDLYSRMKTINSSYHLSLDLDANLSNQTIFQDNSISTTVHEDFENGVGSHWYLASNSFEYSGHTSTNYSVSPTHSYRFELHNTDPVVEDGVRSELEGPVEPPLQEHIYNFSTYLPNSGTEDYALDKPQCDEIIAQWHQNPDPDDTATKIGPPLSLSTNTTENGTGHYFLSQIWDANAATNKVDQNAVLVTNHTLFDLGSYEIDKGHWVNWSFHVKWGWDVSQNPLLEVYKDGILVVNSSSPNTFNDIQGVNQQFGLYKWEWDGSDSRAMSKLTKRVIYFDDVTVSDITHPLSDAVDAVIIKNYDSNTQNTDPNAPGPNSSDIDVSDSIVEAKGYYPANEIVMGLPLCGYDFTCSNNSKGVFVSNFSKINIRGAENYLKTNTSFWDTDSQTPWYEYQVGVPLQKILKSE